MANIQPIEKVDRSGYLSVHSIFATIQGEGPHTGRPSIFVRLAGCNLQCPGCDTEYTEGRTDWMKPETILAQVVQEHAFAYSKREACKLIVITGGEPYRQDIRGLVDALLHAGYEVQLETNGSLWLNLPYGNPELTVVCSPKTGKVCAELEPHIDYYKYVVTSGCVAEDGLPLQVLGHTAPAKGVARPPKGFPSECVYIHPADEKDEAKNALNVEEAVATCWKTGYRLGLQIHKIINLP